MADAVEEEEFRDDEGLDEHDNAGCDDSQKGNYVHHADDVEDDVPRASHGVAGSTGALEARHCSGSCCSNEGRRKT